MAIRHPSAVKRNRQAQARRLRNRTVRSALKTLTKKVLASQESRDVEGAKKALTQTASAYAKAASKGILHKKTASRKIARLSKRIHKLASGSV